MCAQTQVGGMNWRLWHQNDAPGLVAMPVNVESSSINLFLCTQPLAVVGNAMLRGISGG
jgi:hypothetical protein